jgi:hypothetical protein
MEAVLGTMVDVTTFTELLVSHRRLTRADNRKEGLRGLRDRDTGELFLVEERRLKNAQNHSAVRP